VIRQQIHTRRKSIFLRCKCKIVNITQIIDRDMIFLCENSNREKSQGEERGKFTITRQFIGITSIYWYFFELGLDGRKKSPLAREESLFILNSFSSSKWSAGEIRVTGPSSFANLF